jgi:hypothetical protein
MEMDLTSIPNGDYLKSKLWFTANKPLQYKVAQVIRYNIGPKVNVYHPNFKNHIYDLIENNLFNKFKIKIKNFKYLSNKMWFCKNKHLQYKLLQVVNLELSNKVQVHKENFETHIDTIIQDYFFSKFEVNILNFDHLKTQSWFKNNVNLYIKIYRIIKLNLAGFINVYDENFIQNINQLEFVYDTIFMSVFDQE